MDMNFQTFIFYAFAAVLVGAAVGVVTSRNPVYSALLLVLAEAIGVPWLAAGNIGWLFFKLFMVVSSFLWFRATFPRYRYDQIMRLGWKVFIPVTILWIVVLGAWMQTPLWVWWK